MNYTIISVTGHNLNEIYSLRIGKTPYSLVGPYLSTGDFFKSLSGTNGCYFTKINSGAGLDDLSLTILVPPIHRDGEKLSLISNDQILDIGALVFQRTAPVVYEIFPNPERIGQSIAIRGESLLGIEQVIFGAGAPSQKFNLSPDGNFINNCVVPENAGSGFLKVVNFNDLTGVSSTPFYPYPKINSLGFDGHYTGLIDSYVTILGSSFNHVTGVRFNSVLSKEFIVDSNFQITARVPSGRVNGRISVSGHSGTFDVSDFDFEAIPVVTGQFPLTGKRGDKTTLLGTGVFPEILFAGLTGIGGQPALHTGYLISFEGLRATGLFYLDGPNLTGFIPQRASKGVVSFVKNETLISYPSNYTFQITGISPIINSLESERGTTGTVGFTLRGQDFGLITGLALKNLNLNKTYDLSGTLTQTLQQRTTRGFYVRKDDQGEEADAFILRVNGLTGVFSERFSSTDKPIEEGKYHVILIDSEGVSSIDENFVFHYATPPVITGFYPLSGYLTSVITAGGTGLYNGSRIRLDVTGKRINLTDTAGTYSDGRTALFSLKKNEDLQEILFNSSESPKEFVTGFLYFENNFYPGQYSTGDASGIVPFTVFSPPFISGFSPANATLGDRISISGLGFREVATLKLSNSNYSITNFTVTATTGISFSIDDEIFYGSQGGGFIKVTASGGQATTDSRLDLNSPSAVGVEFIPQPAFKFELTVLTGQNLRSVNRLSFSGVANQPIHLDRSDTLTSDSFITGSGIGTGIFLQFKSPADVISDRFVELVNFDGNRTNSNTVFKNIAELLFTISGYKDREPPGDYGMFVGPVSPIIELEGSGFASSNAKFLFGTGLPGLNLFKQATVNYEYDAGTRIVTNSESGMNGVIILSGSSANGKYYQIESVRNVILLPQIQGVNKTGFVEDDIFVVSGINNFSFFDTDATGDIDNREAPLIRLAISGARYGSTTKEVEFINYNVSGLQIKNGNVTFSGRINSEFAGTGQLFLITPLDEYSVGTKDFIRNNQIVLDDEDGVLTGSAFLNPLAEGASYTQAFLPFILSPSAGNPYFISTVTINEKQSKVSGFSPSRGRSESTILLTGNSLRAVTGVVMFSGSVASSASIPEYEGLYSIADFTAGAKKIDPDFDSEVLLEEVLIFPVNYGSIKFTVPSDYTQSSGKFRLLSKNYSTETTTFFKIVKEAAGQDGIVPTGGVAGDLITLNGENFSDIQSVKFVTLDRESISGAFSLINDNQITVTVPNEGRLPAPQIVSIRLSQEEGDVDIGEFEVRQGSEKFFGNIQATGYISGLNFSGSGPRGRPTVDGIEVLLVGEGGGGGGGGINITGGIDTDSASEIFTGNGTQSLFGLNSGIHTGIKGSTQQIRSASVLVSIDGLMQNPVEHYTIVDPLGGVKFSGLQFTSVPISGSDIEVRRFGDTVTIEIVAVDQAIIYALVLG